MNYLDPLVKEFEKSADLQRAVWMKNYMKGLFPYFGIDTKTRRSIQKDFLIENGLPSREKLFPVLFELWEFSQREFQYFAVDLLMKFEKKFEITDIDKIEKLIINKSWWDSVDGLASSTCGSYFKVYPEQINPITRKWIDSGNIWLQRSSLLFQLKYKNTTNVEILSDYIGQLASSKEFFIRKAIGWILREYSKTNPDWVRNFITKIELSGLSYREATKYI